MSNANNNPITAADVCALYCVYDDAYWLPYSVQSIYPVVSKIFIFVSNQPWYGPRRDQSATLDCIAGLADPESKIELIQGNWDQEIEQRNHTLAVAAVDGFKYGLIIDSDEIYEAEHLLALLQHAAANPDVDCWHVRWFTYWKSLHYRIDPPEPYDPAVLIKLGTCGFLETRNPAAGRRDLIPPLVCMCHHLSYAISEQRLQQKHISFPGHSQTALANWYEQVWKKWDSQHDLTDLHPNNPSQYKRAVRQEPSLIPSVLRQVYLKGGLP